MKLSNAYMSIKRESIQDMRLYSIVVFFLFISPILLKAQSIQLQSPNGGEFWQVGKTVQITWNSTSVVDVRLKFSIDAESPWNEIVNSVSTIIGMLPETPSRFPSM